MSQSPKPKKPYLTPKIQTYAAEEILACLGPAVAVYGPVQPSDRRFKKQIESLRNSGRLIGALRGVSYAWRTDEFEGRGFPSGRTSA